LAQAAAAGWDCFTADPFGGSVAALKTFGDEQPAVNWYGQGEVYIIVRY